MKTRIIRNLFLFSLTGLFLIGCSKDEGSGVVADFTYAGAGNAPCKVTFTNTSSGALTYSWTFGDGGTSMETNPDHTFANPGTYNVKLVATNGTSSKEKVKQVVITKAKSQPVFSTNFPQNLKTIINSHINDYLRFIRFDQISGKYLVVYETGFETNGPSEMLTHLNAYTTTLNPACYIDSTRWLVVWAKGNYKYANLTSTLVSKLSQYWSSGFRFERFDIDHSGNQVITTDAFIWGDDYNESWEIANFSADYFAYGWNGSSITRIMAKSRSYEMNFTNNELKNKCDSILNNGFRFTDIEMGEDAWVILYQ
jgi:PKD repeat protein